MLRPPSGGAAGAPPREPRPTHARPAAKPTPWTVDRACPLQPRSADALTTGASRSTPVVRAGGADRCERAAVDQAEEALCGRDHARRGCRRGGRRERAVVLQRAGARLAGARPAGRATRHATVETSRPAPASAAAARPVELVFGIALARPSSRPTLRCACSQSAAAPSSLGVPAEGLQRHQRVRRRVDVGVAGPAGVRPGGEAAVRALQRQEVVDRGGGRRERSARARLGEDHERVGRAGEDVRRRAGRALRRRRARTRRPSAWRADRRRYVPRRGARARAWRPSRRTDRRTRPDGVGVVGQMGVEVVQRDLRLARRRPWPRRGRTARRRSRRSSGSTASRTCCRSGRRRRGQVGGVGELGA